VVREFAAQDARFLVSQGAKVIIIACNTASALAADAVRAAVDVQVFEVVTPAVEAAAKVTKGRVGVIGTRGTIASGVYKQRMAKAAPKAQVFAEACPLFVPLVEEGWANKPEARTIANGYLRPLRLARIDTLILGCTHYPFLRRQIAAAAPGVRLIDPAAATVIAFQKALAADPALAKSLRRGKSRFFVSDRTPRFQELASRWLGHRITLKEIRLG
jgi:glutamate racemase